MIEAYRDTYLENMILTANPIRAIVLIFEKAIESLENAKEAIENGLDKPENITKKCEGIFKTTQAITILLESLDMEKGKDVAKSFKEFYELILNGLIIANLKNDLTIINNIIMMLTGVKEAWEELEEREYGLKKSVNSG